MPDSLTECIALSDLVHRPMPGGVRGALLRSVPPLPDEPIRATWVQVVPGGRLRPARILLSWTQGLNGGMDVAARLGLASAEVALATWPGLRGDWTAVVHPTVYEVADLHAALSVATNAPALVIHLSTL